MKYDPIDKELFILNRKNFSSKLQPNSLAIFNSNDEMPKNGDQSFIFRQNADIYYLSGIDQEQSLLLIYPDCPDPKYKEVLLLRKTSELIAIWEGHKYNIEEAREASGIETIVWMDEIGTIFPMLMNWTENVYLNLNENDRFANPVEYRDLRYANDLRSKYPAHSFHRSQLIMKELRAIKSDLEVNAISTACDITRKTFERVCQFVRPGVMEYEIEAEIMHEFLRNRATGYAYYPIIASGKNACVLHYVENNKECKDGDLLLMDFGAEYANYAADLTRTIPVNGSFTDRQKDVYNAVLRVMKASINMLRPGTILDDYHKEVGKLMEQEFIGLGLLDKDEVAKQDNENPLYKKYFMHGTSHHLGLDVHDLAYRYDEFKPGMVLTCEPGIYILEEGIGIRIENDILVTDGDPVDLMAEIPVEAEEIENMMQVAVS
ncbi:MAG: aminopeptidase P N-terminal domain-containing protein [Bacteroidetes bacterium]|nr:aminopeptidase P N-terminal domain-containing protein [Bacteroidota bacterium]